MKKNVEINSIIDEYNDDEIEVFVCPTISRIKVALDKSGILYRIFHRIKSHSSIKRKLEKKYCKYCEEGRGIQDYIGVRIVVYFRDDIDNCISILKELYKVVNHEVDNPDEETFKPQRINYVFRLPELEKKIPYSFFEKHILDSTFEVQFRTIFSEGWHEVEHDMRYKHIEDWSEEKDSARELNALFATLELCDNNIIGIFDNIAYKNYKHHRLEQMVRYRFRLRFIDETIDKELAALVQESLYKNIFRFSRDSLITIFFNTGLPVNIENTIFIINWYTLKDEKILKQTPHCVIDTLSNLKIVIENERTYDSIVSMKYL